MTSPPQTPDRRRQWLIGRGLLSPNPGPSRRLANLIPRHQNQSPSPPNPQVSLQTHPRTKTPIVVAEARQSNRPRSTAPRAVSLPTEDQDEPPPVARTASTRAHRRDRAADPPTRKRFHMPRGWRRGGASAAKDVKDTFKDPLKDPLRARRGPGLGIVEEEEEEQIPITRKGRTGRTVHTVVDREMPRGVLEQEASFAGTSWVGYQDRIDLLAEDVDFMSYLTAPVRQRGQEEEQVGESIAVNKLYPLAFIRLLEMHAKCDSEKAEPVNPDDELHRYDDPDREQEEDMLVRTQSSGVYDMGRFRTVVSGEGRGGVGAGQRHSLDFPHMGEQPAFPRRQRGPGKEERRRSYQPGFLSRLGRESRSIVPVC